MDDIALAEGQSIVVPVPVDIGGDDGGIAGAAMSWDSWSLTDWRGESHIAAASDDFAEYAPDKVMVRSHCGRRRGQKPASEFVVKDTGSTTWRTRPL